MHFRRHKKSGPYRSFQKTFVDIIDRGVCGSISEDSDYKFRVRLMVKSESVAGFRWVLLKAVLDNEADARAYVTRGWDIINEKFDLVRRKD